jgi:hypothetical protein
MFRFFAKTVLCCRHRLVMHRYQTGITGHTKHPESTLIAANTDMVQPQKGGNHGSSHQKRTNGAPPPPPPPIPEIRMHPRLK